MNVVIHGRPPIVLYRAGEMPNGLEGLFCSCLIDVGELVESAEYLGAAEIANRTIAVGNHDGRMTALIANRLGSNVTVQGDGYDFRGVIVMIEIADVISIDIEP